MFDYLFLYQMFGACTILILIKKFLTDYKNNMQISFSPSHSIPNQLLPFYAVLWLYLRNNGQVRRCSVWSFVKKARRITRRCTFNTFDHTRFPLSSSSRTRFLGLQAPPGSHHGHVARHVLVCVGDLDLRPCLRFREEHLRETQTTILGGTKIQYASNKLIKAYIFLSIFFSLINMHIFNLFTVSFSRTKRENQ